MYEYLYAVWNTMQENHEFKEILETINFSKTNQEWSIFWSSFSQLVIVWQLVCTKTIIHLIVTESGGYLPQLWWIIVK